jgi:hypothetical protein
MRWRLVLTLAVLGASLAPTATADPPDRTSATPRLAYVGGTNGDTVWLANADGTHARALGPGGQPILAPNGSAVAASVFTQTGNALVIFRPGRSTQKYFNVAKVTTDPVAWSPDSRYVAVELFDTLGNGAGLAIVDTKTATTKTIATGSICGASFSPDLPDQLVYGRSSPKGLCVGTNVDLFTAAVDGTGLKRLTHNGRSLNPVWGDGEIAFDHEKLRKNDAPIYQIWLMHPDGTHLVQLPHLSVPTLLAGLVPTQFSGDGQRLLAEYEGQDTSETWTIQISTKVARHLTVKGQDVVGGGLSQDGKTVLVDFGGFMNPSFDGTIEAIPFAGGPAKVLVKHAAEPSWNK